MRSLTVLILQDQMSVSANNVIFSLTFLEGYNNALSPVCLVLSCVQLFAVPWTVAHQVPVSMGILQARILEWVAMPSSKRSSQPRDQTQITHTAGIFFTIRATREAQEY